MSDDERIVRNAIACEDDGLDPLLSVQCALQAIVTPLFEELKSPGPRPHDWRKYVPEAIRTEWVQLSLGVRLAIYLMADRRTAAEEWD